MLFYWLLIFTAIFFLISGKPEDCLVKEDYNVSFVTGTRSTSSTASTPEGCASACSENEDFTVFSFQQLSASQTCTMFSVADLKKNKNINVNITSGICPKSKKILKDKGVENIPSIGPNFQ